MKLYKYNQFIGDEKINENLDKAKKFLKDRYILGLTANKLGYIKGELKDKLDHKEKRTLLLDDFTEEQQSEIRRRLNDVKLSETNLKMVEKDPEFLAIRELTVTVGRKIYRLDTYSPGWMYPFTYFYYVEMLSIEELKDIFTQLIEYSGLLNNLPKRFDANFIDTSIDNNAERLIDGLDSLGAHRSIKRIIDKLTPELKKDYNEATLAIKQQFDEVATAFGNIGKDLKERERLIKSFFGEVRTIEEDQVIHGKAYKKGDKRYFGPLNRYHNIREFIKAAQNFLKSSQNQDAISFYEKVEKCNDKFGWLGADIVFDENGILILEVKSFVANQFLNGHTRHCIKDYSTQWDSYVANHNNKQYYIYNFNIPQYDNLSTIGITIAPGPTIRACHAKDDSGLSSNIQKLLHDWEKKYEIQDDLFRDYLKPMTKNEIERREKAKIAEREIVKKDISIEKIIKYVKEDGANINKDQCVALQHAVENDDLEKAKVILELGGNPNLKPKTEAIIDKAKSLKMIKLLVANGSDITGKVFVNISNDYDAVDYCIKQGLDPNFDTLLPVRTCCRGSWVNRDNIGEGYFDVFKLLLENGAKLNDDNGRNVIIKWAAEYARFNFMDYCISKGLTTGFANSLAWLRTSRKIPDYKKEEVVKYLVEKIQKYEPEFIDDLKRSGVWPK